jgi:hypothetical protein
VPADPCVGEVLSDGTAAFFNRAICVSWSELSPSLPCRAENGSESRSQRLGPLLRGRTERFRVGRTVRPLWGRIVAICKCLWGKSLQCWMVRVGVSQCLSEGGLIIKALKHIQVDTREKILFTYTCVVIYHCIQYSMYFGTCRSM